MIRRADGKWWSDKDKEKKFSTLEEARAHEDSIPDEAPPKVSQSLKKSK